MSQSYLLSRRQFLTLSSTLSAGALLVACAVPAPAGQPAAGESTPEAAKSEVLLWDQFSDANDAAAMDQMVAEFNEQNPDILIVREAQASETMRDILRTSLDAGSGPDVMYYDTGPGFAGVLARAGLL